MPATPLLPAAAALVALPVLAVTVFLGSGAADPPPPGTVCTVQATPGPGGPPPPAGGVVQLTADQVANARIVVAATKALALPEQAAAIAVMTARQESDLLVLANPSEPDSESYPHQSDGDDHDSVGLFQQRPSQGWGTVPELMDPGYASSAFLTALAHVPGWQALPMWQAAQDVQHSADGTAYAQWQDLGTAVAAALWDGTDGTLVCTTGTPPGTGTGPLPPPGSPQAAVAIAYAQAQLGKPYQWGGTGPAGYDCSGLTMTAYRAAGITLPRTAETQWSVGTAVPTDQLSPGDLVFFNPGEQQAGLPGHVGIYLGNGLMIDAPHTGTVIRIEPVAGFGDYLGARRVV